MSYAEPVNEHEASAVQFCADNPGIWECFERFTWEAIEAGRQHLGAKAIGERIRWYVAVESRNSEFKLNNNHLAYFARWFEAKYPQHEGFFRFRAVREENAA